MSDTESKGEKKLVTIKNAADLQRLKIEKLMKNPDKLVVIPERPKQKALAPPPDFVRNVMGSSAGAGSGEFHVYRHLRRKEYARQKFIQEKSEKEKLDEEYHMKIEQNKRAVEEKTAKKRAKRLRKKKNLKLKSKQPKKSENQVSISQSDSSSDEEKEENNEEIQPTREESRQNNNDSKPEGKVHSVDCNVDDAGSKDDEASQPESDETLASINTSNKNNSQSEDLNETTNC